MKANTRTESESGFAHIPLLIAVALGAVLVAAFVAGSRTSGESAAEKAGAANASAVIQMGQNLIDAYAQLKIEGYGAETIEFNNCVPGGSGSLPACSSTSNIGLWSPVRGTAVEPTEPEDAVVAASDWHMDTDIWLSGVGATGTQEIVAYLPNVSDAVCRKINGQLHGTESIPTTGGADFTANDDLSGSGSDIDMRGDAPSDGWRLGCLQQSTTPNKVFFATLEAG